MTDGQYGYYKVVHRDCHKCEHYQPVTKGLFECARNFPPECCVPQPKRNG